MGLGLTGVIDGIIDTIDFAGLGRAWARGHGEIGIASGFAEDVEFIVDAAPTAVGAGIVQGPVAVDEGVFHLAGFAIAGEQAMAGVENLFKFQQLLAERDRGFVVVVEVEFNLPEPGVAKHREPVDVGGVVLFDGVEE